MDSDSQNQSGGASRFNAILYLIVGFIAAYMSWTCNKYQVIPLRILYAIFAYFFNYLYLVYYFIYRILFRNYC